MVEELKDAIANNSKPTTIYYCYDDSGKLAKPAFVADDEQQIGRASCRERV